ncbi:MAG TPA: T9SS type A sorting domain-containing protein [Bacteroidia bacterium]|nr:T9SS type A sorting domain-containing protein [Bacteroidia bacterium]
MKKLLLLLVLTVTIQFAKAQTIKVLFDAKKAQMAGNADWVVDADQFNIGTGSGGIMQTGSGNEANPQRYPTPAQSGITSTTSETFWKGGLSAWGVACAKLGYTVETLPYNGTITYGSTTNAQDLSKYKIYVVCEPNIKYTAAEKTAILQFVQNGGGLFMIADHTVSDRNNDGWDSPAIWNDLLNTNTIAANPFGITFDLANFSQTTTNFASLASNTVLHGSAGNPTKMKFANGTSMTLNKTKNPNALGLVFKTGSSTTGTTGVMLATSKFGTGKVVGLGDSSPADDGTGDTGDALYNGWTVDAGGDHARIIMNATIWLTNTTLRIGDEENNNSFVNVWPNPFKDELNASFINDKSEEVKIVLFDLSGRMISTQTFAATEGINQANISATEIANGSYILEIIKSDKVISKKVMKL